MNRYLAIALVLSALFVGLSLASGVHRRGALLGSTIACLTGIASMLAMAKTSRASSNPTKSALAVMSIGFLVRLVLVGVGTILVVRAGESVAGFIAAFFVPYFVLAGVEGAYVHSLRRGTGPTA